MLKVVRMCTRYTSRQFKVQAIPTQTLMQAQLVSINIATKVLFDSKAWSVSRFIRIRREHLSLQP